MGRCQGDLFFWANGRQAKVTAAWDIVESGALSNNLLRWTKGHQTMAKEAWLIVKSICLGGQMPTRPG